MSPLRADERFSNALRAELVSQIQQSSPARVRRRLRLWLGAGALAGAGLLGGIGAAAAGLFTLPGGEQVTPLATPLTVTHVGTATVQLGDPPTGTTGIEMRLLCLTPGRFEYDDGASSSCTAADIDRKTPSVNESVYTIPLAPGQKSVTIRTGADSRWQLTAKYVKQERSAWAVNAKGQTYGVEIPGKGVPDLIAVIATSGSSGYVYAKDLYGGPMPTSPDDAVKNFSNPIRHGIPVYLSDGETRVGVFEAGGGGGIPSYPSASPSTR